MCAHTHYHQPLGVLAAYTVGLRIPQGANIYASLCLDLFISPVVGNVN